jgi:hypothetical protein
MTEWRARDLAELKRFLRADERWRGTTDEIAVWLDRVFTEHVAFLASDEVLWEIAEERLFAIHGRTAGEALLDVARVRYTELALQSSRPTREPADRRWKARLGWFALGYVAAIFSVPFAAYWIGRRLARETVAEVRQTLQASPKELWPVLSDVRQWPQYDFPEPFDDDVKLAFSENTTGVGATVKTVVTKDPARKAITAVEPNQSVSYESDTGWLKLKGTVTVKPTKQGSEVTWRLVQAPVFFSGWFGTERAKRGWESGMKRTLKQLDRQLRCGL